MNAEDKAEIVRRLFAMQNGLRDVTDAMEVQAAMAKQVGATGLATASYLLKESVAVYSNALRRFVAGYIAEEDDSDNT
jgi:hypothetical protein